jgi:hypothetical protein
VVALESDVRRLMALRPWALLWLALAATGARADDPCATFAWDVAHERALFATEPTSLAAGTAVASAPSLAPDRLYELRLSLQPEVAFAVAPGRAKQTDGGRAGLAQLTVAVAGLYRISIDRPFWLDVVAGGALVGSKDFQGRPGCSAPHKIVEFTLAAGMPLTLQFSGAASPTLKVAITRSPPAP